MFSKQTYTIILISFLIFTVIAKYYYDKRIREVPSESKPPWEGLPSIFEHIKKHIGDDGKLTKEGMKLPDDERRFKDESFRWVAGGLDAMGYQSDGDTKNKMAKRIASLVERISEVGTLPSKIELYELLKNDDILDYLDTALEKILKLNIPLSPYLELFVRDLIHKAADRGPVKFGIAMVGLMQDESNRDSIITLGKHDEFTLYSAVAIRNMSKDYEEGLWELAKSVDGWGKIQVVEHLAETDNPDIKAWLLREGYKNDIMYEYLAYTCAVSGGLKQAITKDAVDDQLIEATKDILEALLNVGPAESIDDYKDAAEVTRAFFDKYKGKIDTLDDYVFLSSLKSYLDYPDVDWEVRKKNGWTQEICKVLSEDITTVLEEPRWHQMVKDKIDTKDENEFYDVERVAELLKLDLWDTHWKRIQEKPLDSTRWFFAMKKCNNERIDQLVELAVNKLPLDEVATGPGSEWGLGPEFNVHSCFNFIIQDLGKYPGKGMELIRISIKSPVIRDRNMALKALSQWGVEKWPSETKSILEEALSIEPVEDVKKDIKKVIKGESLDY
jgi:hypothetical protein